MNKWAVKYITKISLLWLTGILIILPMDAKSSNPCGDLSDMLGHGGILWTENSIIVQGTAAPNLSDPLKPISAIKHETQRAATLDAFRKAAGILSGITITKDLLASGNLQVISSIQAYVPQPVICKTKFYSDGGIDIVVKVPLSGALANALLPSAGTDVASGKSKYTGLIIDASALPFTPAVAPRLLAPNGSVLFSPQKVQKRVIMEKGAVKYVSDRKMMNKILVGNNPLRLKAIRLGSLSPSDIVLEHKAPKLLAGSPAFLGKGRVVIITPPVKKIDCRSLAAEVKTRLIDWERKILLVRGFGKANFTGKESDAVRIRMMERAAEVDAEQKLLEAFMEMKVNGNTKIKNTTGSSGYFQGVVRNAVRCGAKYYKNGTAEVILVAPFDGPTSIGANLGSQGLIAVPTDSSGNATGLIIDALGQGFNPVLAPEIMVNDGTLVYGQNTVSSAWARQGGIVGYSSSIKNATSEDRIGSSPLVIKAVKDTKQPWRLILNGNSIHTREQIQSMSEALIQGRVIIVTENVMD